MNKIRIITDSTSDLPRDFHPSVTVLPMSIRFGDQEYLDGVNLSAKEFYEKLIESDELPATSLVSPAAFSDAYKEALANGESILVITVTGQLSGTYQSAVLAASDHKDQIYVVDSENVSVGEQILVRRALEYIEAGLSLPEIAEKLEKERKSAHVIAVLDTLEYLKKGGRISSTVAFVGGMLSIKPVVAMKDGNIVMLGKARGSKNGNNYLVKEIEATGIDFSKPVCLGYTGLNDSMLRKYIADSRSLWDGHEEALQTSYIGAAIGTHVGPGAIAVAFFDNQAIR